MVRTLNGALIVIWEHVTQTALRVASLIVRAIYSESCLSHVFNIRSLQRHRVIKSIRNRILHFLNSSGYSKIEKIGRRN